MQIEGTRVCAYCEQTYPADQVTRGKAPMLPRCRECKRTQINAYHRSYRQTPNGHAAVKKGTDARYQDAKALLEKMKSGPCVDCGGTFIPRAMHFDHRDPTAKYRGISAMASSNRAKALLAEIAKCDLVCANCHAYRTERQVQAGLVRFGRPRKGAAS